MKSMAAKNAAKKPAQARFFVESAKPQLSMEKTKPSFACEGECGLWLHRGCASIPSSRYESLSTIVTSPLCVSACCSNFQLKKDICA